MKLKDTETAVTLWTLCGCSSVRKWLGIPPQEIRIPIRKSLNVVGSSMPSGVRIRTFKMLEDSRHPFYHFDEEPEP